VQYETAPIVGEVYTSTNRIERLRDGSNVGRLQVIETTPSTLRPIRVALQASSALMTRVLCCMRMSGHTSNLPA
jgi:hypothetical protein